jgi:endonuclease/exonuclease/phosphatase family metal-dependent hydrolase
MRICIPAAGAALLLLASCSQKQAAEPKGPSLRIATFNVALNRPEEGGLIRDLSTPDDAQAKAVAEIIQRVNPDVILLNEFDYDALGRGLALFQENYLSVAQNGAAPVQYPYQMQGPVNTGVASGVDLDRNGSVGGAPGSREYGGDAFGYGAFPGQYGMVILSKHPFDSASMRSFQNFLWKDMPGALLPDDAATPAQKDYLSPEALAVFRLSSKSHWDAPVVVGGKTIHILAGHPTPPVFDGPEDRNGKRNHDEIRLWADYIAGKAGYLVDDDGKKGSLEPGARFVILGDLNADPQDGDGVAGAANQLLLSPFVQATAPESAGAAAAARLQAGSNGAHKTPAATDTSDFFDGEGGPGNLRLDYVLPSKAGLAIKASGVFWPAPDEPGRALVGEGAPVASSDHRLVWVDVQMADD